MDDTRLDNTRLDDTTLDKPCAKNIELVSRHWSGKHHRVVWGINLLSLVWTQFQFQTGTGTGKWVASIV